MKKTASLESRRQEFRPMDVVIYAILIAFCVACVVPFIVAISASLSDERTLLSTGYSLLPKNFSLQAYTMLFATDQIFDSYRNAIDLRILPFFKGMRLEDIDTNTIQAFYNKHEGMTHSSIHQMSVILHQVFDLAVEDEHMKFNPTESKRLFIKGTKQKREDLRDCDVKEIVGKLSLLEAKDRIPLAILLYTGARQGEALALRWENLDWKMGVIHIEQAVAFLGNQPVLGDTKSEAGIRTVPFDECLMEILRPYRQISGFIVGDGVTPMTERTFTRMWQRIGRTIDLHGATPHTFRHTYITLAASSGIDVKTLQSIAGHSDIKMTMERYAHKRNEKIVEAGARIRDVFSSL